MKKEILLWMLVAWQITPTFANQSNIKNNVEGNIVDNFFNRKSIDNTTYQVSTLEILQNSLKQQIIKWTLTYFENDVSFKLTADEKENLTKDISNYLNKYPDIIKIEWNNVLLNLNETNFRALFKTLLPYLLKSRELNKYAFFINNTGDLALNKILKHLRKAEWKEAEKYFFHQFWYLIKRIVEQTQWNMTIWYYRQEMLKAVPNKYVKNKDYSNILDLSISELPKYF